VPENRNFPKKFGESNHKLSKKIVPWCRYCR